MQLFECKDVIRAHLQRFTIEDKILTHCLSLGWQMIEGHANFWWMRNTKDFNLILDTASYNITTSATGDLALPNFKDARALIWKDPTAVRYDPVLLGKVDRDELDLWYDTDDEGHPEHAIIENVTLLIYPPKPQILYNMNKNTVIWPF